MEKQKIYETKLIALMFVILVLAGLFSIKQEALSYSNDYVLRAESGILANCTPQDNNCNQAANLINYTFRIFLALILWTVSPAGIMFFLASGTLISRKSSKLKRALAWIVQILALFVWMSFMTLLLLAFLDSVTLNVFGLGGNLLDTAIVSGMVFFVVLFLFSLYEKKIQDSVDFGKINSKPRPRLYEKKEETDQTNDTKGPVRDGFEKIKDFSKDFTGIKDKIRRKAKDTLKEIIDDEIERRL